ncbi:glycosyltransferase [Listeria sp. SHR_NRA_18]|uniref:glycosyltransferase family 4 protein n=1 Tax=Listeria TaxID=1637 RepID=UPI00051DB3A7|nr:MULTISPECIES: glycosyltransferase family 4 protein [Listeria]KGL46078.1 hypothetical protein EP56_03095 [Listeriaceae bacterium FSL A5-0209]KMT60378.1 putative capsular polysaccharide synthesis enzyme [Listeria newyorkensis]RQW66739.1 glycosyltransferase [Listeria sp. SHR_NRA_18]
MKKIIVLSSVHPWNDSRIYHKEVLTLLRAGYQVDYYAVEGTNATMPKDPRLTVTLLPRRSLAKRFLTWWYFLREIKRKRPAAVHLHDPELLFLVPRIKKVTRAKIVFDMHEDFPSALKSKRIKGISVPDWCIKRIARYEKKRLAQVDTILFAEKYYKANYLDIVVPKEDVLNYPFLKEEVDATDKFEVMTLVYAGAIHEIRGFKEMLEVASMLKQRGHDFQLLIIGQVPERLQEWAASYLEANGLEKVVYLKGRLDLERLNHYYEKSDIGLALLHPEPNYLKSLPTKLFEYMSFGLPYVASDFPLWRKLMEDSGSGTPVNVKDIAEIVGAIEELLSQSETYMNYVENGRYEHVSRFNWQHEEKKLLNAYELLFERI